MVPLHDEDKQWLVNTIELIVANQIQKIVAAQIKEAATAAVRESLSRFIVTVVLPKEGL